MTGRSLAVLLLAHAAACSPSALKPLRAGSSASRSPDEMELLGAPTAPKEVLTDEVTAAISSICSLGPNPHATPKLSLHLGSLIEEVEARFGPRDHRYTLLGAEFSGNYPQLQYGRRDLRHMVIHIAEAARGDDRRTRFQLAHEVVHLLDPVLGETSSVLEEGLATQFQLEYIRREAPDYTSGDPKYDQAALLASKLIQRCPSAIRRLRARAKRISDLTASELRRECPTLACRDAQTLARKFATWDAANDVAPCRENTGAAKMRRRAFRPLTGS